MKSKFYEPDWTLFFFCILILVGGTLFFRMDAGRFDIEITNYYYDSTRLPGERFFLGKQEPWNWLRKNDGTFTLLLVLPLLLTLMASFIKSEFQVLRKYALFGLTSVLLGSGLLVNVLFKGYWGRPRPREVLWWPDSVTPDNLPFYKVWDPAFLDGFAGRSFPCGHASIVIAYLVIFYMFKHPEVMAKIIGGVQSWKIKIFTILKYAGLSITFIGGGLMGLTRIVQGAHFASDVLWSYGMVLSANWILYYFVFKIPKWEMTKIKTYPPNKSG
jgi:membrane-associated PAP2 superfamily phosphatase